MFSLRITLIFQSVIVLVLLPIACGSQPLETASQPTMNTSQVLTPPSNTGVPTEFSTPPTVTATFLKPPPSSNTTSTVSARITVKFQLIPHKPGIPPIRPHPLAGFEVCTSCHFHPEIGMTKTVSEKHACDQCHVRKTIRDHTLPLETACVACHLLTQ
jgi:hypothetical protein